MAEENRSLPEITDEIKRSYQPIRRAHSAGGIAYRVTPGSTTAAEVMMPAIKIALIATRGGACWQIPKGTREVGETPIETAIREVEEEVGLWTKHRAFLKTVEYWYWDTYRKEIPDLVHKKVDFYLLDVIGGELSDASYEVDSVGWFTLDEALKVLTFEGERAVVKLAIAILSDMGQESGGAIA